MVSYSGLFQPATTLSPARPGPIWSFVASCLAVTTGWLKAVCTVEKTVMRSVAARSPAAHVAGSSTPSWKFVAPP